MTLPLYQVDAFASRVFAGNPAAVVPLEAWPDTPLLQNIAAENNLSETAFFVARGDAYEIRWFTPACEVDLCGHATLASAYVIFRFLEPGLDTVRFSSRSGPLVAAREDDRIVLDFPSWPPAPAAPPDGLAAALGAAPNEVLRARDLVAVFDTEGDVRSLRPDMNLLLALPVFAVAATAPGASCDFVSRFFAPAAGIPEDPVTGSSHCTLAPFWGARLGKNRLHAAQVSSRGGELFCEVAGDRVRIAGRASLYLEGIIHV